MRLSLSLEHLLNVLPAILVRRLEVVQPLGQSLQLGLILLDLRAQFLLQRGHRKPNEPDSGAKEVG